LRAFCSIVSLTAAKTSRIFDVSVACVRLAGLALVIYTKEEILLGVEVEMCSVDLVESPEKIFGGSVDIISSRVIREIVAQR
jgi:hypothetical protein